MAGPSSPASPETPKGVLRAAEGGAGRLLSVREVTARLAVSAAIVYRFYELGELAHVRISNAHRVRPWPRRSWRPWDPSGTGQCASL
jgi:hypothetical protein